MTFQKFSHAPESPGRKSGDERQKPEGLSAHLAEDMAKRVRGSAPRNPELKEATGSIPRSFTFLLKFLIVGGISIGICLGLWLFLLQKPGTLTAQPKIHFYNNPTKNLSKISLKVFYFVPSNRQNEISDEWFSIASEDLKEMQNFHSSQFSNYSILTYKIYPQPIIGLEDNFLYDKNRTNGGNPHALTKITREIEARVLDPAGDLYNGDLAKTKPGVYEVLAIFYEGVGASGTEGSLLLSRGYLTQEETKEYRSSVFYHEFLHTLGVPDFSESDDIMGKGRLKPLGATYISDEIKKKMGL